MEFIIVDERISEKCERSLLKEGFTLFKLPPDPDLGEAVRSHPDTALFYSAGELITTADYCNAAPYFFSDLRNFCPNVRITFTSDRRSAKYPEDCSMNALLIGSRLFCKSESISDTIKTLAEGWSYEICPVNQGYPACTVLAFGNRAITADRGMARALADKGIEVTLIRDGHIALPPHEYGFIGGASGVYGNKVYFFGDLMSHPDGETIREAILSEGFTPISLSDEPLRDLGGIIFL
nr:hypothetical protein [Oscillospiraceae bacterium]